MFDRVLKQMRDMVRARRYIVTLHAEEEMADDDVSVYELNMWFSRERSSSGRKIVKPANGNIWFRDVRILAMILSLS